MTRNEFYEILVDLGIKNKIIYRDLMQ